MSKIKKIIIAFAVALIVYGLIIYIYNTYIKQPHKSIYILKQDIAKEEIIRPEILEEIKILGDIDLKNYISKDQVIKEKGNILSAYSIRKGQILNSDVVIKKSEISMEKIENFEYISLDVKNAGNAVSYQIKKGSLVNIYYTSKSKIVDKVIASKEKIYSSNSIEANVTCKLIENTEIIGIYDSKSNIGVDNVNNNNSFDTIVIRVSQKDAMMISNLKDQGQFNLTIVN